MVSRRGRIRTWSPSAPSSSPTPSGGSQQGRSERLNSTTEMSSCPADRAVAGVSHRREGRRHSRPGARGGEKGHGDGGYQRTEKASKDERPTNLPTCLIAFSSKKKNLIGHGGSFRRDVGLDQIPLVEVHVKPRYWRCHVKPKYAELIMADPRNMEFFYLYFVIHFAKIYYSFKIYQF
jgi:hypothetical protein